MRPAQRYGLVRRAEERGLDMVVCAPGHILKTRPTT
jgi:hypothetical protein